MWNNGRREQNKTKKASPRGHGNSRDKKVTKERNFGMKVPRKIKQDLRVIAHSSVKILVLA
jgi:hypothetical protein